MRITSLLVGVALLAACSRAHDTTLVFRRADGQGLTQLQHAALAERVGALAVSFEVPTLDHDDGRFVVSCYQVDATLIELAVTSPRKVRIAFAVTHEGLEAAARRLNVRVDAQSIEADARSQLASQQAPFLRPVPVFLAPLDRESAERSRGQPDLMYFAGYGPPMGCVGAFVSLDESTTITTQGVGAVREGGGMVTITFRAEASRKLERMTKHAGDRRLCVILDQMIVGHPTLVDSAVPSGMDLRSQSMPAERARALFASMSAPAVPLMVPDPQVGRD